MLRKSAALLGVCLVSAASPPLAYAEPATDPVVQPVADVVPAPPVPGAPGAPIASASPGTLTTPDGWVLTVSARNESIEPVASLTNSPWSREYLVDSSFEGTVTGDGKTKLAGGLLDAGYQIGCGITQDALESISGVTGIAGVGLPFATGTIFPLILGAQASQVLKIGLKPGTVNIVQVGKKSFKGTSARVTIRDIHIKVDNCVGASSLRSYAILTSSNTDDDDIVAYYGVTKVF